MTTSLATFFQALITWSYTSDAVELSTPTDEARVNFNDRWSNGAGALKAQYMFHDRRRLTAASPTDDLDLAGGLVDVFGNTLTFSNMKLLAVHNKGVPNASPATAWTETAGEDLSIGDASGAPLLLWGGASPTGDEKLRLRSGGILLLTAPQDGYPVAGGSADVLRITLDGLGSNDIDYDIVIMGD